MLLIFFLLSSPAQAEETATSQGILALSKMTGACGILDSMIDFQSNTKMSGGNEFVARFWAVEAARLGYSVQELSDVCDRSITIYDRLWKDFENFETEK